MPAARKFKCKSKMGPLAIKGMLDLTDAWAQTGK
jgi:hypothetical protein